MCCCRHCDRSESVNIYVKLIHTHRFLGDFHLFPAELAYSCLQSVPIVEKDAISLLDGWAAFLEWQSDPTYRANPPDGYLYPGFDVMQAVADLRDRVTTGNITTEFDLQDGIRNIVFGANDGHMAFMTDFNSVFYWQRATSIISISADGSSVPEVWAARKTSRNYKRAAQC